MVCISALQRERRVLKWSQTLPLLSQLCPLLTMWRIWAYLCPWLLKRALLFSRERRGLMKEVTLGLISEPWEDTFRDLLWNLMVLLPVELPENRWGAEYLCPGFMLAPVKGRRLSSTQRKHSISQNCKPPRTSGQEVENVSSGQRKKAKKSGEEWQPRSFHPCLLESWRASRISALSCCYFKWSLNLNGLTSNFQHYNSAKIIFEMQTFPG